MDAEQTAHHVVAVIGGAVAGAQVASILAEGGARCVVFEQGIRPFGKIEDGLPSWHSGLRDKEVAKITELLSHPRISFVPSTKIGRDIEFKSLVEEWGFSAVVLANGVWRDRPLPIPNAERFVGKGLIYQNPLIKSFNHTDDASFDGERIDIPDGALVVGGGLASIDMAKLVMLHHTQKKLAERGYEIDFEELEKKGLPKACEEAGVSFESLGIEGATLIYRRAVEDMPVASAPPGADEARMEKVRASRKKILDKAMDKFLFRFEPLASPVSAIEEDGRLVGLELARMHTGASGKLEPTGETFELRGNAVISSIGSIPEPIPGIDMKGELFAFSDWELGQLDGMPTVFSAGNVVTGKGNIIASRKHSSQIGQHLSEAFLGLGGDRSEMDLAEPIHARAAHRAEGIAINIAQLPAASEATEKAILDRVAARHAEIGYPGTVQAWLDAHPR